MDVKLGARLKEERKRLKLGQREFGACGGVAANAQWIYEKDGRAPNANYLVGIRKIGVDVLYVLTGVRTAMSIEALSVDELVFIGQYRTLNEADQKAIAQIIFSISKV
ncbi:MAG: Transcriptional regulator, Cro/CI family [Pseudomonas sp.]|nr:Transcriptional regulator, Cro/CI family [Pseudomonas sp.]